MMLVAHGNISKLLWPGDGERRREREPLRHSLDVTEPFDETERDMRNHYEHLDKRLDEWWDASSAGKSRFYGDYNIGPIDQLTNIPCNQKSTLRHYDPKTKKLLFWGSEEWDVQKMISKIADLRMHGDASGNLDGAFRLLRS